VHSEIPSISGRRLYWPHAGRRRARRRSLEPHGPPKLLLPSARSTVLGSTLAALRHGGAGRIALVCAPGDAELLRWAPGQGVELALNPDPDRGMLSSIWAGSTPSAASSC
jgi:CTP:molybdopterin cytidylyltransferase MocA